MNMKYFRFLYGETAGCFTHFGELNDTLTNEHVAFLYLSGISEIDDEMKSENTLLLYPKYLDMVVLGEVSRKTTDALKKILLETKVGTLVVPDRSREHENGNKNSMVPEVLGECLGDGMLSVEKVISVGNEECRSYEASICGWKFFVKCSRENELALIHAMAGNDFEDVVMNVKGIRDDSACHKHCSPDNFGCAFGCTLHRDYHECKYREKLKDGIVCRTGTVLMKGNADTGWNDSLSSEESDETSLMKALLLESGVKTDEIRFFGFSGNAWREVCREISLTEKEQISGTEYFIGSDSEVDDAAIGEVCRSGRDCIPVLLKDGQGICCSGFFKYRE